MLQLGSSLRYSRLLHRFSVLAGFACGLAIVAHAEDRRVAAPPEPSNYRLTEYRSPTPLTLQGATVVTPAEARALAASKSSRFIDVMPRPRKPDNLPPDTLWHVPEHRSIPGSVWLPNVGYGVLSPEMTGYFTGQLERLTGGDRQAPLLFFCLRDCWMSWNAAKRALSLGYSRVYWFPDGAEGWLEAGGAALEPVEPAAPAP